MSQTIISESTYSPPEPRPWMVRAAISIPGLWAPPASPLPMAKRAMATIMGFFRPNMSEICPKSGCGTVEVKRNELTTQTYSLLPPMSRVMVGREVVTIVASTAEMKDSRQRTRKTHHTRHECLNVSG